MSSAPDPEEAAAVIAAIERFLGETTVVAAPAGEGVGGWLRAARSEAVGREPDDFNPWL